MKFTVIRDLLFGTENEVPGAGFEPAKLYAEDLESTPFDRSGTPACSLPWCISFLTIPLELIQPSLWVEEGGDHFSQVLCQLGRQ